MSDPIRRCCGSKSCEREADYSEVGDVQWRIDEARANYRSPNEPATVLDRERAILAAWWKTRRALAWREVGLVRPALVVRVVPDVTAFQVAMRAAMAVTGPKFTRAITRMTTGSGS